MKKEWKTKTKLKSKISPEKVEDMNSKFSKKEFPNISPVGLALSKKRLRKNKKNSTNSGLMKGIDFPSLQEIVQGKPSKVEVKEKTEEGMFIGTGENKEEFDLSSSLNISSLTILKRELTPPIEEIPSPSSTTTSSAVTSSSSTTSSSSSETSSSTSSDEKDEKDNKRKAKSVIKTTEALTKLGLKFQVLSIDERRKEEKRNIEENKNVEVKSTSPINISKSTSPTLSLSSSTNKSPSPTLSLSPPINISKSTSPISTSPSPNLNLSSSNGISNTKLNASSPDFVPSHLQEKDVPLNTHVKIGVKYEQPNHLIDLRHVTQFNAIVCVYPIVKSNKLDTNKGKDHYPKYDPKTSSYVGYTRSYNSNTIPKASPDYIFTNTTREAVRQFFKTYPQFISDILITNKDKKLKLAADITKSQNMLKLNSTNNLTYSSRVGSVLLEFENSLFCDSFYYVLDECKFDLNLL